MKHNTVKIYKSKSNIDISNYRKLKIDNKEIKFLKNILLENSDFLVDKDGNWILKFFVGKPYEQNLLAIKNGPDLDYNQFEYLSALSIVISSDDFNEDIAEKLSLSLRNSKAVKCKDFTEYPSHLEHIDGRGISFFSKIAAQEYNFERQVILYSLAYAYLGAIEFLSTKLAEEVNCHNCDMNELNKLYIEATKFNSVFFFHQPVMLKNASLTETWKYIDKILDVNISENELLERLSSVHYILNLDDESKRKSKEREQQIKQDRWNFAFAVIGIFIGLVQIFA